MRPPETPPQAPTLTDRLVHAALFAAMVVLIFTLPNNPTIDLDASWRMALSYFFKHGLQFGREVVFTYGPLGFLMGRTYCGLHFSSLLAWQAFQAVVCAGLIFRQGARLGGYPRLVYFIYFFVLGFSYEDALHQMVIALAGFELLRHSGRDGHTRPALFGLLLALFGLMKFTDLILGAVFVLAVAGHELWLGRRAAAGRIAAWFFGGYGAGWMLCGQNPFNLPSYLLNSWEISQGYQDAMGLPTPVNALWKGLVVLGLIIVYAALHLLEKADRPRAVAAVAGLGAYTYLNWKHGFVRADGHMIGFFYCMLLVVVSFPALVEDGPRWRVPRRLILAAAGILAVIGVETALPGVVRGALGNLQEKFYTNVHALLNWQQTRLEFFQRLSADELAYDLPATRKVVGSGTLDVLGHEQGVAIYNRFNYHPRPVFQGYSAYTPRLAGLNFDFYASADAPEYVLMKMHSIDRRFSTFDDSEVLHLLVQRYEYVLNEKGFHLWHRKPGPFDAAALAPKFIRGTEAAIGRLVVADDLAARPLWATVDLRPSLLGRLRSFFYKPAFVQLRIIDNYGAQNDYRLPLPQGQTGFIVNPLVEDMVSYMRFAGAQPERRLHALAVEIAPQDRDCFADEARITFSALPPSTAGQEFFRQAQQMRFHMFKSVPVSFHAQTEISEDTLDGHAVMVLHAPSEMVFEVPVGAREITGSFGFLPGAYSKEGRTDGAVYSIVCLVDGREQVLMERMLDPVHVASDRGLLPFRLELPKGHVSHLFLRVDPGPNRNYSWDWTTWTGIEIK